MNNQHKPDGENCKKKIKKKQIETVGEYKIDVLLTKNALHDAKSQSIRIWQLLT